jgi:hypothetical protein
MPAQSRSKNGVASLAYVAGIHAEPTVHYLKYLRSGAAWMAGASPAMTNATSLSSTYDTVGLEHRLESGNRFGEKNMLEEAAVREF